MTKRMEKKYKVEMGKQDERLLRQVLFQSLLASNTAYLNFIIHVNTLWVGMQIIMWTWRSKKGERGQHRKSGVGNNFVAKIEWTQDYNFDAKIEWTQD